YNKKIKDLSKELGLLVSQKKMDEAKKLLPQVYKIIDKATKVNVLKKNTASRRKSKMARMAG
ncbi:MAG: 30S ribosomal protein S20, partial [Candidatus Nealsonbacteria bacterium CG_4_8_14_3_um_filter_39_7]